MEETVAAVELAAFLVEAKRGTYAAGGEAGSVPSPFAGARQFEYRRGGWLYRDLYYGSARFAGQEVVYLAGTPVWSMVYAGGLPAAVDVSPDEVYGFLRLTLQRVTPERPFRGPEQWEWQGWRYASSISGDPGAVRWARKHRPRGSRGVRADLCRGGVAPLGERVT